MRTTLAAAFSFRLSSTKPSNNKVSVLHVLAASIARTRIFRTMLLTLSCFRLKQLMHRRPAISPRRPSTATTPRASGTRGLETAPPVAEAPPVVPPVASPAVFHLLPGSLDDAPPAPTAYGHAFAVRLGTLPEAEAVPVSPGDSSDAPLFELHIDDTAPVVLDETGRVILFHGELREGP